jgi:chemotaxis protein MotB
MHVDRRSLAAALVMTLLAACGVAEEKYNASVAEAGKYRKGYEDESQKTRDLEAKLKDREARLAALEQAKGAALSEAERQRLLASQLAQQKQELEKKSSEYEALSKSLSSEIQAGRIQISELQGKMTVRLAEKVLFPSGSATLARDGKATLEKVADAFKDLKDRIVRVEGHTDNVPIKSARFPSNWELSAARAIAVVRFLQEHGVDPSKLAAAGYAEFQPIAPNDTPEGRSQNRRIEISLAAAVASPAK